jgi:hypothetical protein
MSHLPRLSLSKVLPPHNMLRMMVEEPSRIGQLNVIKRIDLISQVGGRVQDK